MKKITLISLAISAVLAATSSFAEIKSSFDNNSRMGNLTQTGVITGVSLNINNDSVDVFTDGKLDSRANGDMLTLSFTGKDMTKGMMFSSLIGKEVSVGYSVDMYNTSQYKVGAVTVRK